MFHRNVMAALFATMLAAGASAQGPAPPAADTPVLLPVVDPAKALEGPALVEALRKGGFVLFIRHARQAGPQEEAPCTHANLAPDSEAQVKRVAAGLTVLRIPVGLVLASPVCRALETARLLGLGEPEITQDLRLGTPDTPQVHAARAKRLAQAPPPGANTLLVSHGQGSLNPLERMQLELLEIVVFRPDGRGGSEPVARIRIEDWDRLR